jgi:hypothetical protein
MMLCYLVHLNLFNPSSTTYVKHFIARTNHMENDPRCNG